MKKIFTLITGTLLFSSIASAQLLMSDNFNYSGLLTANGWIQTAAEGGDPISTTTGLSFPGYPGSGLGNAANLTGTLQDVTKGFTKQTAAGTTIWLSAMVNVTEATNITGNGINFLHLGDRDDADNSIFNNFAARIYVKANSSGVFFGASNTSSSFYNPTPTVFARNTTYLLVLKLTFQPAAVSDLSLWVFPASAGTPQTEADLGTPEVNNPSTVGAVTEIDAVALRQAPSLPDVVVDGIRVSNTYQQISLPLNLTSFKAMLTDNLVRLNWTSLNEENVKNFSVERSNDGRTFTAIGTVDAINRNQAAYSFADNAPLSGVAYYRLKMADKDGAAKYSSIAIINNRKSITAQVFPNPTFGSLNVSHPKATTGAFIKVMSVEGRIVRTFTVQPGAMQTNLSVVELVRGNYLLVFESNGEKSITKFVKQ